MKLIELFKRPKNTPQIAAATNWLGVEVPAPVVRRYFTQHAEDELDVPLSETGKDKSARKGFGQLERRCGRMLVVRDEGELI